MSVTSADEIVQQAHDPATTAARLAEIVAARPDLGAAVAQHPNVYDGLLDWLAVNGDAEARAAVQRRRTPVPPPAAPAPPPPPLTAPPLGFPTLAPSNDDGSPEAGSSGYTELLGALDAPPASAPPVRRRKKGLLIGLVAGGAALVLIGGGVAWANMAGLFGGAPSPQAAAEKLIQGTLGGDPIALLTVFAPSEVDALRPAIERLASIETGQQKDADYLALVADLRDSVDVTVEGLEFETEPIAEGIEVVRLVAGTVTIDGDPDEIAEAVMAFDADYWRFVRSEWSAEDLERVRKEQQKRLAGDLSLPWRWDVAESLRELNYSDDPEYISPFTVVTVDEGGWYVSPMLSSAEVIRAYSPWARDHERGSAVVTATHFDSPEAAIEGAARATERYFSYGDINDIAAVLPLPERRLVSLYGPIWFDRASSRDGYWPEVTVEIGGTADTVTIAGNRAQASPRDLEVWIPQGSRASASVVIDKTCWTYEDPYSGRSDRGCIRDVPGLSALGLDDAKLVVTRENGGWLVNPLATFGEAAATATASFARLAAEDRLDELRSPR